VSQFEITYQREPVYTEAEMDAVKAQLAEVQTRVEELEEDNIKLRMKIEDLHREILFLENPRIDGDCMEVGE